MDVFRNIFGTLSGGLSIFTNNSFQRKKEQCEKPEKAAQQLGGNSDARGYEKARGSSVLIAQSKSSGRLSKSRGTDQPGHIGSELGQEKRIKGWEMELDDKDELYSVDAISSKSGGRSQDGTEEGKSNGKRKKESAKYQTRRAHKRSEDGEKKKARISENAVENPMQILKSLNTHKGEEDPQNVTLDVKNDQANTSRSLQEEKISKNMGIKRNEEGPDEDLTGKHSKKKRKNKKQHESDEMDKRNEQKKLSLSSPQIASHNRLGGPEIVTQDDKSEVLNGYVHQVLPAKAIKKRSHQAEEILQGKKKMKTHETRKEKLELEGEAAKPGSKRKLVDHVEEKYEKRRRMILETARTDEPPRVDVKENESGEHNTKVNDCEKTLSRKRKRQEEEEEEDVSKKRKTFDDEAKLRRTIFVGNLPVDAPKKDIMREFSVYGVVESVRLRSVPLKETKLPRKGAIIKGQINEAINSLHAYIVFKTEDCAKAALAHNMKEFRGNHIRVDTAYAPRKVSKDMPVAYDRARSIFLGNVPFDVKDEELYQLFGVGKNPDVEVEAVRVVRDPQNRLCKGIAFVLFRTKVGANRALSRGSVKLRGRALRIFRALPSQSDQSAKLRVTKRQKEIETDGARQRKRPKLPQAYEGTRASKKGSRPSKWSASKFMNGTIESRPRGDNNGAVGTPGLKKKRPAVAAKKAHASKSGGTPTHTGQKRKRVENRQRGSSRAKKIRRA